MWVSPLKPATGPVDLPIMRDLQVLIGRRAATGSVVRAVAGVVLGAALLAAPGAQAGRAARPASAPADKVVDEGTFVVTVAGKRAGQEFFQVVDVAGGHEIRSRSHVAGPTGTNIVRGKLRTDERWRPVEGRLEWLVGRHSRRVMVLKKPGEFPELTTESSLRSLVYTRPQRASDLFFLSNPTILGHLYPLCGLAGTRERTLTAFPAAPLRLSPTTTKTFPQTKMGAPALELRSFIVDLAQSARFELVCDGSRLLALRQAGRRLTAVRASYEAVASALEAFEHAKPPLPDTLAELPRKLALPGGAGSPATTVSCALTVPGTHAQIKKAAPGTKGLAHSLPAVVLLGDAGVHDRDGDAVGPGDPGLSLLKRLAIGLGHAGVASFRCDARGAAGRGAAGPKPTLDALAADGRAMLAALRKEPAVDPERLSLVGHGEGALVGVLVAERDGKLRALSLLAMPGRPLDKVILERSETTMRRFGYPEAEIAAALAEEKAVYEALRAGKPLPASLSPAERKALRTGSAWLRSHLGRDPAALVSRLRDVPVLLAVGGKDMRLSSQDIQILREALEKAGNKRVTTQVYPELTHPFASASSGSLSDYLDPRAEVADAFIADVARFVRKALEGEVAVAADAKKSP
jgi:dienelactone hydrolase